MSGKNNNGVRRRISKRLTSAVSTARSGLSKRILPKIKRALGPFRRNRKKEIKGASTVGPVTRIAAPELSAGLKELMEEQKEFILWLGPEFTKAAAGAKGAVNENVDGVWNRAGILKSVVEILDDQERKAKLHEGLDAAAKKSDEEQTAAIDEIQAELENEVGADVFSKVVSNIMNEYLDAVYSPSGQLEVDLLPLQIVKALKPKCIVYTGTDKLLEKHLAHDNIPTLSMTVRDMVAKRFTIKDLGKREETIILKIHGDVDQLPSLKFTKSDIFSIYGLNTNGTPVDEAALSPETKYITSFLQMISSEYPVIFAGHTFKDDSPLPFFLQKCKESKVEEVDAEETEEAEAEAPEGESPPEKTYPSHFALVAKLGEKDSSRVAADVVGVEYITYSPDEIFTQVTEFLGQMLTAQSVEIPEEIGAMQLLVKGFLTRSSEEFDKYTDGIVKKETSARVVSFLTNGLPKMFTGIEGEDLMGQEARCKNLQDRIMNTKDGYATRFLFRWDAVEEELPLDFDVKKGGADVKAVLDQYKAALEFAEKSSMQIRCFETKEPIQAFSLMTLETADSTVGEVTLFLTTTRPEGYNFTWFELNTNSSEEKALLFERMWDVSLSQEETIAKIKERVESIENRFSETS